MSPLPGAVEGKRRVARCGVDPTAVAEVLDTHCVGGRRRHSVLLVATCFLSTAANAALATPVSAAAAAARQKAAIGLTRGASRTWKALAETQRKAREVEATTALLVCMMARLLNHVLRPLAHRRRMRALSDAGRCAHCLDRIHHHLGCVQCRCAAVHADLRRGVERDLQVSEQRDAIAVE